MLRQSFGIAHVPVAEGLLPGHECVLPCLVWLVLAWVDGDKVADRPTKEAHGRGEVSVTIWCVPVLQHGSLEFIGVQGPISGVLRNQAFDCFHTNLSTAVAMGEGYRGQPMLDPPILEELFCFERCELWSTIGREFLSNAVRHECAA